MKELLELILNKLEELEEENRVNGSDVLAGISMATMIVEECFEEFENKDNIKYKCRECNNTSVKNDIARATKNYLDIGLNYNKNYNIQVCPKCGTIFDNDEGFELIK